MKRLNQPLFIGTNLARDESREWYLDAVVKVLKQNKEFKIASPRKSIYAEWIKWDKAVDNFFSAKFNLGRIPLACRISKDDAPVTIMFDDVLYDMDP